MLLQVEITEVHLKKGLRKSYTHDPVCLAIKDAVKKQFKVECRSVQIFSQDYGFLNDAIFDLPEQVRTLMKLFDSNKPVMPITFELRDLPEDLFSRGNTKRK